MLLCKTYDVTGVDHFANGTDPSIKNRNNYIIQNLKLTFIIMDNKLGEYYTAGMTCEGEFPVCIDPANVSSITGGYGFFGLYAK